MLTRVGNSANETKGAADHTLARGVRQAALSVPALSDALPDARPNAIRIAIATDVWFPQVGDIVRTLGMTIPYLRARGHEVELIVPDQFISMPMPRCPDIRLRLPPRKDMSGMTGDFAPDIVHIVTEGPVGWGMRRWCMDNDVRFTTTFRKCVPDHMSVRTDLSADWFWPFMQHFHAPAGAVFAPTRRLVDELTEHDISGGTLWPRGVDTELFTPDGPLHPALKSLPRPILLSVGRVAAGKNLDAFLASDIIGTKVVVGYGPALSELKRRYPATLFMGMLDDAELAGAYRAADVFVFPGKTDGYTVAMIEALACGVPVAGFPVAGPLDIIGNKGRGVDNILPTPVGALNENLRLAITAALNVDRMSAAAFGRTFDWTKCSEELLSGLRHAIDRS